MTLLAFWQSYWFILVGAALFIFTWLDGFDLGIGMMLPFAKTPAQRQTHLNTIWPLWDGNELYGLIGGGAIFASFPVVFAGLLSGLYPWVVILMVFVMLRPVSFEAWVHDRKARRFWEFLFSLSSFFIPFVIGVAVGSTMAGLPYNANMVWDPAHSFWEALSPLSVLMGAAFVAVSLVHGSAYLVRKTTGELAQQARSNLLTQTIVAALLVAAVALVALLGGADLTGAPGVGKPFAPIGVPLALALLLVALVGIFVTRARDKDSRPFVFSSLLVGGLWLLIGAIQFPTMVRSSISPDFDLTIFKDGVSNPIYSLQLLGILGFIGLAIVGVYTVFVYRIFKGKIDASEMHY
jgi:cytochrome d ubiquinol oxidase subunit II